MTGRDWQRSAVYAAEQLVLRRIDKAREFPIVEVAGSTLTLIEDRKFGDIAAVQRYVDAVLALDWVRAAWPRAALTITVRRRRGDKMAHYEQRSSTIAVFDHDGKTSWAMREIVVLHEIAHHLTNGHGHGPQFTDCLARLVADCISPETGLLLRVSYDDTGAQHQPPRGGH